MPAQSLWRDADFRRLWCGQTASMFAEQSSQVTLPLVAVVALHAGATELGALRAAEQVPILLFSLFIGVWVDRWRSRTVMVLSDALRALVLLAVPISYLFGVLSISALFVVAFVVGLLSSWFYVAYQASLVRLVDRDRLAQGNSALEGSRSAAQVGGPALGGAIVSLFSAPAAVLVGAFGFTASFLSIRRIRRDETIIEQTGRTAAQIRDGLRLVIHDASLRAVSVCSALFQFSFAALMTVYLLFLPRTLHLSGAQIGLVMAAIGPGAVAGSLLSARLPQRFGYGVVLVSAAALGDAVMLCIPALRGSTAVTVAALMAMNFVFGLSGQLVDVTVMAVRQSVTPIRMQGRVVATLNVIGMGLTPLGSLLGGYLGAAWGLRTSLLVTACGLWLSPLVMTISPLSRLGKALPVVES